MSCFFYGLRFVNICAAVIDAAAVKALRILKKIFSFIFRLNPLECSKNEKNHTLILAIQLFSLFLQLINHIITVLMKKLFYYVTSAMLLVACVAGCTNEPSLVGKWKSDSFSKLEDKTNIDMVYEMTLNADSTFQSLVAADMKMSDKDTEMRIPFNVSLSGKWSDSGTTIIQVPDTQQVKVEFVKDSLKIEFKDPDMALLGDKLKTTMMKALDEEMSPKFKGEYAKSDTVNYTLNGDVLTFISKSDTIVFKRVVEKKK